MKLREKVDLNEKKSLISEEENNPRVIYVWSVPANGHLNPTLCFTNQLLLRLDEMNVDKIVFYSGVSFRDLILNLPNNIGKNRIEFRDYDLEKSTGTENLLKLLMNFDTRPGTLFRVFQCFENGVKLGSKVIFNKLLADIHRDKPVLILYDQALFFPKLALNLYEKRYNCAKPLHGCYVTTFLCAKGVYPYWSELKDMGLLGNNSNVYNKLHTFVITFYDFCKYVFTYYKTLWWDFDFSLYDLLYKCDLPISKEHLIDDKFNLVFVLPEVQPRLDEFQKPNVKFVGPCVDESVRSKISKEKFDMDKYVKIIDEFLEKNAIVDSTYFENGMSNSNDSYKSLLARCDSTGENFKKYFKPIIYVSMGTVFNNENTHLFTVLVEACKSYGNDYAVIVSTGDEKTYEKYKNSNLNSDGKILLVPHTPQVEILKRAHLFITHAGMNSVSEAVNYGVPIICLPLSGDQPFVAWRVADELGMGIRLQPDNNLTIEKVKDTINEILTNPVYRNKANDLSKISKMYNGHKTACDLTVNLLVQDELEKSSLPVKRKCGFRSAFSNKTSSLTSLLKIRK